MAEQSPARVGIYFDFDNIVISRYNQLHGKNRFALDGVRNHYARSSKADPEVTARIARVTVDIGAILDFASSFGTIVMSRAYADWSALINASYQWQLTNRAVDLTQLFSTSSLKNGADIRLAVDVIEDVFRLEDLTHIIIVAGDSDYIPLAQRCKRLGRYVVGIGVSGSTSRLLASACDEFADYDALPGIEIAEAVTAPVAVIAAVSETDAAAPPAAEPDPLEAALTPKTATRLLMKAMTLLAANDQEWQHASSVKLQMRRMDPSFQERTLGFGQFSDFLKSRNSLIEIEQKSPASPILLRMRD